MFFPFCYWCLQRKEEEVSYYVINDQENLSWIKMRQKSLKFYWAFKILYCSSSSFRTNIKRRMRRASSFPLLGIHWLFDSSFISCPCRTGTRFCISCLKEEGILNKSRMKMTEIPSEKEWRRDGACSFNHLILWIKRETWDVSPVNQNSFRWRVNKHQPNVCWRKRGIETEHWFWLFINVLPFRLERLKFLQWINSTPHPNSWCFALTCARLDRFPLSLLFVRCFIQIPMHLVL